MVEYVFSMAMRSNLESVYKIIITNLWAVWLWAFSNLHGSVGLTSFLLEPTPIKLNARKCCLDSKPAPSHAHRMEAMTER